MMTTTTSLYFDGSYCNYFQVLTKFSSSGAFLKIASNRLIKRFFWSSTLTIFSCFFKLSQMIHILKGLYV